MSETTANRVYRCDCCGKAFSWDEDIEEAQAPNLCDECAEDADTFNQEQEDALAQVQAEMYFSPEAEAARAKRATHSEECYYNECDQCTNDDCQCQCHGRQQ